MKKSHLGRKPNQGVAVKSFAMSAGIIFRGASNVTTTKYSEANVVFLLYSMFRIANPGATAEGAANGYLKGASSRAS